MPPFRSASSSLLPPLSSPPSGSCLSKTAGSVTFSVHNELLSLYYRPLDSAPPPFSHPALFSPIVFPLYRWSASLCGVVHYSSPLLTPTPPRGTSRCFPIIGGGFIAPLFPAPPFDSTPSGPVSPFAPLTRHSPPPTPCVCCCCLVAPPPVVLLSRCRAYHPQALYSSLFCRGHSSGDSLAVTVCSGVE